MLNQVYFDTETTGLQTKYSNIVSIYMELVNDTFDRLDSYESFCSLRPGVLPEVGAMLATKIKPSFLQKQNKSHFMMVKEIYKKVQQWTPSIYTSFNGINYDHELLRSAFYQNLLPVYAEQFSGNLRHDVLNTVRATAVFEPGKINYPLNEKKLPYFKLRDLCDANGIANKGAAHAASVDVADLIALSKLISEKCPITWKSSLITLDKNKVEEIIKKETFCTFEAWYGKVVGFTVSWVLTHPEYKGYELCWDLKNDPDELLGILDDTESLKEVFNSSPKKFRTVRTNKSPLLLNKSYALKIDTYKTIGMQKLEERAKKIAEIREKLASRLSIIISDSVKEKQDIDDQLEVTPEESIYSGGFANEKDKKLMENFHDMEDWNSRVNFIGKFDNPHYSFFAARIIYEESPASLPKDIYNQIHRTIAERLFSKEKQKYQRIEDVENDIDQKYHEAEEAEDKEDFELLKELDSYTQQVKKNYEAA